MQRSSFFDNTCVYCLPWGYLCGQSTCVHSMFSSSAAFAKPAGEYRPRKLLVAVTAFLSCLICGCFNVDSIATCTRAACSVFVLQAIAILPCLPHVQSGTLRPNLHGWRVLCHFSPLCSLPTHETSQWPAGATPIAHFLGAIVSGSQAALMSSAKDLNLQVGHVKWHATGKYDLRGVGVEEVRRFDISAAYRPFAQGIH